MDQMISAVMRGITAGASYFVAAVSFAISNPAFLAITALMLISGGKSLKLGRVFSVKG